MIAAAPAGAATADKYATYIEQIPAEDGPGMFNILKLYFLMFAYIVVGICATRCTCTQSLLLPAATVRRL
jgi:hypothetical protein